MLPSLEDTGAERHHDGDDIDFSQGNDPEAAEGWKIARAFQEQHNATGQDENAHPSSLSGQMSNDEVERQRITEALQRRKAMKGRKRNNRDAMNGSGKHKRDSAASIYSNSPLRMNQRSSASQVRRLAREATGSSCVNPSSMRSIRNRSAPSLGMQDAMSMQSRSGYKDQQAKKEEDKTLVNEYCVILTRCYYPIRAISPHEGS